jgi:hypothetical protein
MIKRIILYVDLLLIIITCRALRYPEIIEDTKGSGVAAFRVWGWTIIWLSTEIFVLIILLIVTLVQKYIKKKKAAKAELK